MGRPQIPALPRLWYPSPYILLTGPNANTNKRSRIPYPSVVDILKSRRVRFVGAVVALWLLALYCLPHDYPLSPESYSYGIYQYHDIDWSRFAYTQYVTDTEYLCNSVMLFETLHRLGSKAERLLMYPAEFEPERYPNSTEGRLLRQARDDYGAVLKPIELQRRDDADGTWAESYTKLLAFNQTQYDRVLNLDSDANVLQTMDELFLLPPCLIAMPRAYWLKGPTLSSQVILIQPSKGEFVRLMAAVANATGTADYDMEILNAVYGANATVLPHRPYDLITGELRSAAHENYLGSAAVAWDPEVALREAKYLHFSDWPVPKPWIGAPGTLIVEKRPACVIDAATGRQTDCRARKIWLGLYTEFRARRKLVCGNMDI